MNTLYILFILIFSISACTSSQECTDKSEITDSVLVDKNMILKQADLINGYWMTNDFLNKVGETRSIYLNRRYSTKLFGFILTKDNLLSNSPSLSGFTEHEGGYESPLKFDPTQDKFVNDLNRLSEYPSFPDPFELNVKGDSLIEMYFVETKQTYVYRKVVDDQTELRRILFEGNYVSDSIPVLKFDRKGMISGLEDFRYYETIYDFGEGIEYDAIVFYRNKKGGNWSDGEIYKFNFDSDTLNLYHVETNWDEMNHKISDKGIKLIKK